jgi:hypothetical protein
MTDNFTGDVIALLTCGLKAARLEILRAVPRDELPKFIRAGIVESLAPEMLKTPAFVQQIVARALIEHVDWDAVAVAAATDEEAN